MIQKFNFASVYLQKTLRFFIDDKTSTIGDPLRQTRLCYLDVKYSLLFLIKMKLK